MVACPGDEAQILIVGAGPAGSIAAKEAASRGIKTILIDKKTDPTKSSVCGGLVSPATWSRLEGDDSHILNQIDGVRVHPPDDQPFELTTQDTRAYVIDRDRLNADLLSRARKQGVVVKTGKRILAKAGNSVKIRSPKNSKTQTICPKVIIGADGPRSEVRNLFKLAKLPKIIYGIQGRFNYKSTKANQVEVFFGRKVAPEFFAWIIPISSKRARIGLATSKGKTLRKLFGNLLSRLDLRYPEDFDTGMIPMGIPKQSSRKNVFTVGDAAGQVKPTTGGGLYPISITAKIAGKAALKGVQGLEEASKYYREKWMSKIGKQLKKELVLRNILNSLSDEKLTELLKIAKKPTVTAILSKHGEVDHIYPLVRRIAKKPSIWPTLLRLLPGEVISTLKRELFIT